MPPRKATPPLKLYKIGEVMEYSGLSRQTIHNYTVMGLIHEAGRTPAGHRLYGQEVFETLERISELKKTNTLAEIRKVLTTEEKAPAPEPPNSLPQGQANGTDATES